MDLKTDPLKWEDSPGLYHGCGVCGTCLNSTKAKRACYGKHAEPCSRYHQTMFHIGNSHKCEACRKSNDLHEKRHKEISVLIEQIRKLDQDGQTRECDAMPLTNRQGNIPKSAAFKVFTDTSTELKMSSKAKRMGKKAVKFEKSVERTRKRQASRPCVPGIVLASSMKLINKAIHRADRPESTVGPQNADAFFVASIQRFQALEEQAQKLATIKAVSLKDSKAGFPTRERGDHSGVTKAQLPMIREILAELGIRLHEKSPDKRRRALLAKVADAIYADLMLVSNEARETMRRSAGYWRFVNKRTYNAMVRNCEIVSWETGEKLPEEGASCTEEAEALKRQLKAMN